MIFDPTQTGRNLNRDQFVICIQGMEIDFTIEEIFELFNYIDDRCSNKVSKEAFCAAISFVLSKVSQMDSEEGDGSKQKAKRNTHLVNAVMKNICSGILAQKLQIRQLAIDLDLNRTGYLSRSQFSSVCHSLAPTINLDNVRHLVSFYD